MNFFVVIHAGDLQVFRLPVEQILQNALTDLFKEQEQAFFADAPDEVSFSPAHTPDTSEVAYIKGFTLPSVIENALTNPLEQDVFELNGATLPRIRALFGAEGRGNRKRCLFQAFERRNLLDPSGFSILLAAGTFRRLTEPGLTLDTKLTAIYREGRLYFHSFFMARRVLDLAEYYREATDEDLDKFAKEPRVLLESPSTLVDNADQWIRRHIAIIRDSQVMKKVIPRKIVAEAKNYGLEIETRKVDGRERIVFPCDKVQLKKLIRFLEQNYYTSALTGDRFIANSKRPLSGSAS